MIDFQPLDFENKEIYTSMMRADRPRGCEFSFNNLFIWGDQKMAFAHGCALVHSCFDGFRLYPYPAGTGDRKAAIEAIVADAAERGIPCRLSGLNAADKEELETLFPGKFITKLYRNGFDYIYEVETLAELKGRKLQKKRNHINKFLSLYPDWQTWVITEADIPAIREMAAQWYRDREAQNPDGDYDMEKIALDRALSHFTEMGLEGLILTDGQRMLAFTMGSRLRSEIFDTNFEKALEDAEGAYPMINREFARYLRAKYPELRYIDREDDMGIPGLRQAKLSYNPQFVEKSVAYLAEEGFPEDEDD